MGNLMYFPLPRGPEGEGTGKIAGWNITSYFGGRIDPIRGVASHHGGQDVAYNGCTMAPIVAMAAGTISQSWDPSGGGNWTGLTLDDGSYWGFGHADHFAPGARYRRVIPGEVLAYVDSTGASTGPHAHIAYRKPGQYVYSDPYDLLMEASVRCINDTPPTSNVIPPTDAGTPIPVKDDNMAAVRFVMPNGVEYVLSVQPTAPKGLAWAHITSPKAKITGILNGLYSLQAVMLAVGNDAADAMFEDYTVLSGPDKRNTCTPE